MLSLSGIKYLIIDMDGVLYHGDRPMPMLVEYIHPDQFAQYKAAGTRLGFKYVAAGPLVRSSYRTWEVAFS